LRCVTQCHCQSVGHFELYIGAGQDFPGAYYITIAIQLRFDYRFDCAMTNVAKLKKYYRC